MALLRSELDKVKAEVGKLQQQQFMVSSNLAVEESEGEIPLFDLTEESVKKKKKKGEKKGKGRRERPDSDEKRISEKRSRKKKEKKELKRPRIDS